MLGSFEISVSSSDGIPKDNKCGNTGSSGYLSANVGVHSRGSERFKVSDESIGGAVFFPVIMGVHCAAKLSAPFSVNGFSERERWLWCTRAAGVNFGIYFGYSIWRGLDKGTCAGNRGQGKGREKKNVVAAIEKHDT